jgi:hypothetical protein
MASGHSVSFYICAAFLAVFGFVGLNSFDPGSSKIEIALAIVVLAAGLYLHSGAQNGRIVGLVVLGGVIAFGFIQLVSGHYVPGTIVAGLALYRLAAAGTVTSAPSSGYPPPYPGQQPYGQPLATGQPQQMYYGQQPLGAGHVALGGQPGGGGKRVLRRGCQVVETLERDAGGLQEVGRAQCHRLTETTCHPQQPAGDRDPTTDQEAALGALRPAASESRQDACERLRPAAVPGGLVRRGPEHLAAGAAHRSVDDSLRDVPRHLRATPNR